MIAKGLRFPRAMLANPQSERLLLMLGVEIVDETTPDLEAAAREWLRCSDKTHRETPATRHVAAALQEIDRERAA